MTAATDRGRLDQCRSQAVPRRNSLVCPATEYCGLTISTRDASNRSKGLRYAEQTEITVISGEARLHASATVANANSSITSSPSSMSGLGLSLSTVAALTIKYFTNNSNYVLKCRQDAYTTLRNISLLATFLVIKSNFDALLTLPGIWTQSTLCDTSPPPPSYCLPMGLVHTDTILPSFSASPEECFCCEQAC